ncbi:hypothetical protein [Streptomyces sp. NPDC001478]
MQARTDTRSTRSDAAGVEVRLPWWAVVLPALAFAALLLLMAGPGEAHAASGEPAISRLLGHLVAFLGR